MVARPHPKYQNSWIGSPSEDEPEEALDDQRDQMLWFYNEYGIGSVMSADRREAAQAKGWTLCVCTEVLGTWEQDWYYRETQHAEGECSCWCEPCGDHRAWYWAAGPGRKRLINEVPAVEPVSCTCIADDHEFLAAGVRFPRYPVQHEAGACECRCMPCRAWREYQAHLHAEIYRQVVEEQRQKAIAWREEIARKDREAAELAAWKASPEGQAELAAQEAERQRLEAERKEQRQRDFDRAEVSCRLDLMRADTDPDLVRSCDDPVRDIQAMVAACSGDAWRTAADPRTHEVRETWDDREPGDVEQYPAMGGLFMHQNQLVELRGRGCTEHREEVRKYREKGMETTDWEFCTSDCPGMEAYVFPLYGGPALKSYIERQYVAVFRWTGDLRTNPATGKLGKFAGRHWEIVEFDDADYKTAMQALDFRVAYLASLARLPTLRSDGTLVSCTGYDPVDGIWYGRPDAPGQRSMGAGASSRRRGITGATAQAAMSVGLPHRLLEFAQQETDWTGTMTQLKELIGWPGTPKGLSSAIWRDELVIMALGVIIERVDRLGETRAPGIRIRHQIERSGRSDVPARDNEASNAPERSDVPRALPPVILPGKIDPER